MKTLYLSDLDGTLLRSDERLSARTTATLGRFVAGGGLFSYATARSFTTASRVTAGLEAPFPVICYNGAFTVENSTGEVLQSCSFSREEAADIRRLLEARGVSPIIYATIDGAERFSFIDRHRYEGLLHFLASRRGDPRRRLVADADALYAGDVFYCTCIDEEAKLEPIRDAVREDGRFQCLYQVDIYSGAPWCEILPREATKANAAQRLKERLGCDRLVAFGDNRNDLSLFSVADECYAVANAVPELKAAATAVIAANDEDGVAAWIEQNALQY